jgi:hypothetical protein
MFRTPGFIFRETVVYTVMVYCILHADITIKVNTEQVPPLQASKVLRVCRGIASTLFKTSALKMRGGGSAQRPGRFTPRKYPVPILQEAGWAPTRPVWTGAENLALSPGFDPRNVQPVA